MTKDDLKVRCWVKCFCDLLRDIWNKLENSKTQLAKT